MDRAETGRRGEGAAARLYSQRGCTVLARNYHTRYGELDAQYPQYQLAKHKGYPTKLHYELIAQYGIQPFYRRSFLKKQGYWPQER